MQIQPHDHFLVRDIDNSYRNFRLAPGMRDSLAFRYEGEFLHCIALCLDASELLLGLHILWRENWKPSECCLQDLWPRKSFSKAERFCCYTWTARSWYMQDSFLSASQPLLWKLRRLKSVLDHHGMHIRAECLHSLANKSENGFSRRFSYSDVQIRRHLWRSVRARIQAPVDAFPNHPFAGRKQGGQFADRLLTAIQMADI